MNEIIEQVLKEAATTGVTIDGVEFPIYFNSNKYKINEYYPSIEIKDYDEFIKKISKYVYNTVCNLDKIPTFVNEKEKNLAKLIIAYLFCNSTTQDFKEPLRNVDKRINFILDNTLNDTLIETENMKIKCEKNSVYMETPYKITVNIEGHDFPSIYYGIDNNECYIYSLMMPKNNKENKKIKRELYKLNKDVPEELKNVSPSSIVSLTIFLKLLNDKNINKVKANTYLPIRYISRESMENDELKLRNQRIQENITEKFLDTILRTQYHTEMIDIISYPYEIDEYLTFNTKEENINNELLINFIKELDNIKQSKKY